MMYEIAKEMLDLALKYTEDAEIYVEKGRSVDVDIKRDKVDFAKEVLSLGAGVRVIVDGKMGFSYTTNTQNIKKLQETVEKAIFNAKANVSDENFAFAPKSNYPDVKGTYDKSIEEFEVEDAVEFANSMVGTVLDKKCEPTSGGFASGQSEMLILNSEGVNCSDISTGFSGFISVNVEDGEGVSTANESESSTHMDFGPEKIAEKVCTTAKDSRGGKPVETGDKNVVLDHHAASGLLSTFMGALNADNVQRGRSVFAGKLGEAVASPALSIYDDGTLERGLSSSKCDGEGTPTQKTALIENGMLKNFLYDIYTSKKGSVESTGNGVRYSYSDIPSVGSTNVVLKFEDLDEISSIKNGVLVTDVLGAHTSNPISGDFSVEAMNAFKIENGEVSQPIKKAMISGNIFELMKDASAASREVRQLGAFVTPRIMVRNLRVVG